MKQTIKIHPALHTSLLTAVLMVTGCVKSSNDIPPQSEKTSSTEKPTVERTAPLEIDPTILSERRFGEAPILAQRVKKGELPPIGARLPENPMVVSPVHEIGQFGGTIRQRLVTDVFDEGIIRKMLSENLLGYEKPLPNRQILNLAEKYTFFEDGKKLRLNIRKGLRWSDGAPFTVDDILFWYEDMTLDENARQDPIFPSRWTNAGSPVSMEKEDEWTLLLSSQRPLPWILSTLCHDDIAIPKHFFSRHHPRYNPEATYDNFKKLTTRANIALSPGIPRLSAWMASKWTRGLMVEYERNPYYWKVDTEGNQLPYADVLQFTVLANDQLALLKFQNGELDILSATAMSSQYAAVKSGERRGGYTLRFSVPSPEYNLFLNWDAHRPVLREAFRNRSVRIALSHAIHRDEMSQLLANGFNERSCVSFSRATSYYSEEAALRHSDYDPEKARAMLDKAGYRDVDGDGIRELRDGSPFRLVLDCLSQGLVPDFGELVAGYWEAVGIKVDLNIALQEIIVPRRIVGDFEVTITRSPTHLLGQTHMYAPVGPNLPFWHRNADREAPEWLREILEHLERAKYTMETQVREQELARIRDLYTEQVPFIGMGSSRGVWGARNRLGNAPKLINGEDLYRALQRSLFLEQIFIRN